MTTMRRMNARTMTFAVVSSLLFLIIIDLATSIGVQAQKQLAFEEQNPSSSSLGKTTRRTPETIAAEDDDDTKNTDAYGSEGGGEWTFATPASKGLSQSSLEVRIFFLSLSLSLFVSHPREPRLAFGGRGTFVVLFFLFSLSLSFKNHLLARVSSYFRSSF